MAAQPAPLILAPTLLKEEQKAARTRSSCVGTGHEVFDGSVLGGGFAYGSVVGISGDVGRGGSEVCLFVPSWMLCFLFLEVLSELIRNVAYV